MQISQPQLERAAVMARNTVASQNCKYHILCVDDEVVGTRLRREILEEHGYSVTLHHCPLLALNCDLSIFDLAVIDFQMPNLNGKELFLRMRASGARFPIILLAGCVDALSYDDQILFARCIDKGRPTTHLLETIAEFLDQNQIPDFGAKADPDPRKPGSHLRSGDPFAE